MNANGEIYRALKGEPVPPEDVARLDGYQRGLLEDDREAQIAALETRLAELDGRS